MAKRNKTVLWGKAHSSRVKLWSNRDEKSVISHIGFVLHRGTENPQRIKYFKFFLCSYFETKTTSMSIAIEIHQHNTSKQKLKDLCLPLTHLFFHATFLVIAALGNMGSCGSSLHRSSTKVLMSSRSLCDVPDDPLSLCSQLQWVHSVSFTQLWHFLTRSAHWSSSPSGSVQA